ncbi:MAG: peptidylprolyl isomerase [Clostridia bacterium]|nr:peptidylprolyl isomerase [Clostridia bacterium]
MMKKRFAAFLLALIMILGVTSCAKEAKSAITFRDTVIDEYEYSFLMSYYKGMYLYSYYGLTEDNAAVWTSEISEGVTVNDYLTALTLSSMMSTAIYVELFDEYGLSLTAEETAAVDDAIDSLIEKVGNKAKLNSALSEFGANVETLRKVRLNNLKIEKVQDYLYGENGINTVTKEELDEYYNANYGRTKFIFISKTVDYERDENGEYIKNEDGNIKTHELTEEEVAAKKEFFDELEERVNAGEDFDSLVAEYTMDTGMMRFEDGYYVTSTSTFVESTVTDTVAGLEIGETARLETANGWYLIKRYELIDEGYNKEEYAAAMFGGSLSELLISQRMQEQLSAYSEEVVIDEELMSKYTLASCTPNFYYY